MWDWIWWILIIPYVISCVGLIVIVLLQKGKGVGFAGAFGVGAGSETVFGPRASKSLPQKVTYVMAGVFMLLALIMSIIAGRLGKGSAPEKLSEDAAAAVTTPADQTLTPGTLDDLGSALKEEAPVVSTTPVTAAPAETPAATSEPAPAETPAATPELAPAEAPAAPAATPEPARAAPAPAETPAAPAAEAPAPAGTPAAPASN